MILGFVSYIMRILFSVCIKFPYILWKHMDGDITPSRDGIPKPTFKWEICHLLYSIILPSKANEMKMERTIIETGIKLRNMLNECDFHDEETDQKKEY